MIECVPNVSEGRRPEVIAALADALRAVPGLRVLGVQSDASHNRSVFTLAGEHEPVLVALDRLVAEAIPLIDLNAHQGEHPRIGAVDVVPIVPLGDATMDDCVELANRFAEGVARRYDIPVFLYANAARRSDRVRLADVRRGQYEGLRDEIGSRGREPDFGPARTHPTFGAIAVSARPFLIAYNINLDSDDLELAKRIARRVRESSGGLPKVQASGFWIAELGRAQVSMNLLDFGVTPMWLVWDTVRELAAEDGVELAESELIGLAPLAALLGVADRAGAGATDPVEARLASAAGYLRLRDFSPLQALELRLEAARTAPR